jgi:hypothetical protein
MAGVVRLAEQIRTLIWADIPPLQPAHRSRWTPRLDCGEAAQIRDKYLAGSTIRDLAAEFRVHRQTISDVLKRCGVATRFRPLGDDQIAEAVRLYASGLSLARVGERVGADALTIRSKLLGRGVRMRDPQGRER